MDNHLVVKPKAILDRRSRQNNGTTTDQFLIQWEDTSSEEAMWEDASVTFEDGRNVTHMDITYSAQVR